MMDKNEIAAAEHVPAAVEALTDEQISDVDGGIGLGAAIGLGLGAVAGVALTVATAGAAGPFAAAVFGEAAAGAVVAGTVTTGAMTTVGMGASGALVGAAVDVATS